MNGSVSTLAGNARRDFILHTCLRDFIGLGMEAEEMTKQEFWEMIAENMTDYDCEAVCPVKQYGVENEEPLLCDSFGDCADALRELALRLEREE